MRTVGLQRQHDYRGCVENGVVVMSGRDSLPGWVDGPAKSAVLESIRSVTTPGPSFVPPFALRVHHDDSEREFAHDEGAEKALAVAKAVAGLWSA